MDYISAEEFLKQSDKIQKSLLDWWQPQCGDLIYMNTWYKRKIAVIIGPMLNKFMIHYLNWTNVEEYEKDEFIPLFTETQLRKFIEEKTVLPVKLQPRYINRKTQYQVISFVEYEERYLKENIYSEIYDNPLEAYWQVACKISEDI